MGWAFLRLILVLVLSFGGVAFAAEDPFRLEVNAAPFAPGGTGTVEIALRMPTGFHVYRDMLSVQATPAADLTVGAAVFPPPLTKPDPANPAMDREVYEEDVIITVPVTAAASVSGDRQVFFHVRYQGCKKNLCYMPAEQDLTATLSFAGTPALPPATGAMLDGGEASATASAANPVTFGPGPAAEGKLGIHVDLHGDWHLNRMFMSGRLLDADDWSLGELILPDGVKTGNEADGTAREDYEHDFNFSAPVVGSYSDTTLKVEVGYQACKGVSLCLPPAYTTVEVPYGPGAAAAIAALSAVVPPAVAAAVPPSTPETTAAPTTTSAPPTMNPDSPFAKAAAQGFGSLLLLCFLAGVGVSFTPCVLPIVPITMGVIGAKSAGTRGKAIALAGTYVLGQAAVYTGLGLAAAAAGDLFGGWLQSPWIVGGIAAFFVVMGLAMFGFFDIAVPAAITNRLTESGPRGGFLGAAVLGAVGALVAGPCSGPVVASILIYVGIAGNALTGALLMFVFSLGMGMIFLVTGAAMGWLPARGAWMVVVKKAMGIFLWLAAVWFASPQLSTAVTALLTAAVLLLTGIFAWPSPDDGESEFVVRLRQSYSIIGALIGAWLLIGGLSLQGFILPPTQLSAGTSTSAPAAAGPAIPWLADHDEALAEAEKTGKPLMIDFTAEWCAACHEMERYTYTDAAVVAEAKNYVPVMIDCTNDKDEKIKAIQKRYGVTGLPTVVFVTPSGAKVSETIGFVEAPDFLEHMRKARSAG